ncbi:type IV secretory system conjugative DNA transfer family protein [Brucellaceae bacterium D45D]
MNLIIPIYRMLLTLAILIGGLLIIQTGIEFGFLQSRTTLLASYMLILAFGIRALMGDTQGRIRTASGLAMMAALLGATATALIEPANVAMHAADIFRIWKNAGHGIIGSAKAALSTFDRLPDAQIQTLIVSLILALLPIAGLAIWALARFAPQGRPRIAKNGPWRARWMNRRETLQLRHNAKGLPLGIVDGAILRYRPNPKQGWREGHHVAIAGTRAGKGVSVVIPAIIDHDGPVAVLDIKGENFTATQRYRRSLGRNVYVLNPFGVHELSQSRFNPLSFIRTEHLVRDIDVIAEGLVRPESGNGAHFADMAKTIVAAVIEYTMTQKLQPERGIIEVMDLIFSADFEKSLAVWANDPATYGRRVSGAAATYLSAGENERGAIKTTMKKAFDWARSDEMRTFLTGSTNAFADLFNNKGDLFIVIPLDQVEAQAVFMRLITNIILAMSVRFDGGRKPEKNVLLVLDEFVRLGRMEKLLNIANVAAGCGIEALFITQDKGQIESVYGKGDTASILGSCVTARIFGLGRAEYETAKWAENALGEQTILTTTRQAARKFGERPTTSITEQRQKLMTADQILEMKAGKMLLLAGSKPPVILDAIVSYRHVSYQRHLG